MALLQRSCLLSPVCSFRPSLPKCVTVQTQRLAVCRASAQNGSSSHVDEAPTVFKDESNGIICYYDESGDLTCEGWDEGPHFQPDLQQPSLRRRRRFTPRAMQGRGGGETVSFKNIKGRMGESLREVANESLECSEL
ncbi:hypothetical protein KC19_8G128800 [Ceratodon purpureus]|uniref:Uncharacterized protein n=1 Tax=Ceratodon purpureus TaxID=3225 RepID=A0A8T0GY92_CERPU|nr:hypothetical protein KC19_8G128800 [Ceratodon purpureus]